MFGVRSAAVWPDALLTIPTPMTIEAVRKNRGDGKSEVGIIGDSFIS
jgi:hypothetical protein